MLDNQNGSSEQDLVAKLQAARQAEQPEPEQELPGGTEEAEASTEYEAVDETVDYDDGEDVDVDELDEQDSQPRYTVKVDGEEQEVDIDELRSGYQRDADYRKKTMALAEQRKGLEAEKVKLDQTIAELSSFMEQKESEIDWDYLAENDPAEYVKQEKLAKERKAKLDEVKSKRDEELNAMREQYVQDEAQKLAEVMGSSWTGESRKADLDSAYSYMRDALGVNDEEINQLIDHRLWRMAFDAAEFWKIKNKRGKVAQEVKNAPKSVKPGQRQAPSDRRIQEAKSKLKKSDKTNEIDAAVAYMQSKRKQKR